VSFADGDFASALTITNWVSSSSFWINVTLPALSGAVVAPNGCTSVKVVLEYAGPSSVATLILMTSASSCVMVFAYTDPALFNAPLYTQPPNVQTYEIQICNPAAGCPLPPAPANGGYMEVSVNAYQSLVATVHCPTTVSSGGYGVLVGNPHRPARRAFGRPSPLRPVSPSLSRPVEWRLWTRPTEWTALPMRS